MVAHFRIFDAYGVDLQDVGTSTVTGFCGGAARAPRWCVSLPQVVGRAMGRAIADRTHGSILLTGVGRECTGIVLLTVLVRRRKADEIFAAASIRWRGGVRPRLL
jgi:hypothetical protein